MLKLFEVNEENWLDLRRLSVSEAQKGFLDNPVGILARGYVYRHDRARVIGIEDDDTVIGVALVRDLDDEPACYDLQQFMIDARFQGKGCGTAMVALALEECRRLGIRRVLMCCDRDNAATAKTIIRNGGVLENEISEDGGIVQRYWIDLTEQA